jgi:YD repeat-containing protein
MHGQVYQHTNELGLVTTSFWDGLRRLMGTVEPNGSATNIFTVATALPGGTGTTLLNATATRDKLANWTYYVYDGVGNAVAVTNSVLSHYTLYDYCPCGLLNSVSDALGRTTTYSYDYDGRLTSISYPDSSLVNFSYDSLNEVTNTTDSSGVSITNYYNDQRLRFASSNAFGRVFSVGYDVRDRVTNNVDANGVLIVSAWDDLQRLVSRTYPDGGTEKLGYAAAGLIAFTNQLTSITHYGYDAGQRKIAETNATLGVTLYSYDSSGNLINLVDQNVHSNILLSQLHRLHSQP